MVALAIKATDGSGGEFCQFQEFSGGSIKYKGGGDSVKYTTRNSLTASIWRFMAYAGRSKPLNVNGFMQRLAKPAAKVYGQNEYITRKVKGVTQPTQ